MPPTPRELPTAVVNSVSKKLNRPTNTGSPRTGLCTRNRKEHQHRRTFNSKGMHSRPATSCVADGNAGATASTMPRNISYGTRKATTNCRASRQSSSSPSSEACSSATLSSHCPQTDFMYPGRLLQLLLRQQSLLTGCRCSPCFVWCASVWGSHACVFVYWVV